MNKLFKNLLPKTALERVALNLKLFKIKPRFLKRFNKLTIFFSILISLLGYYPTFSIPPIKQSVSQAQSLEQKEEVVSSSFSKPLVLPHPGYLSTKFSTWHPGVDIAIGLGMPIRPIIDGEVIQAGFNIWGLGNYVTVSHEKGFISKYAHLGKIYAKLGQKVTSENILGEVGLTGYTSGPHTHLEITHNGRYIDPQTILPEIPNMPQVFATR